MKWSVRRTPVHVLAVYHFTCEKHTRSQLHWFLKIGDKIPCMTSLGKPNVHESIWGYTIHAKGLNSQTGGPYRCWNMDMHLLHAIYIYASFNPMFSEHILKLRSAAQSGPSANLKPINWTAIDFRMPKQCTSSHRHEEVWPAHDFRYTDRVPPGCCIFRCTLCTDIPREFPERGTTERRNGWDSTFLVFQKSGQSLDQTNRMRMYSLLACRPNAYARAIDYIVALGYRLAREESATAPRSSYTTIKGRNAAGLTIRLTLAEGFHGALGVVCELISTSCYRTLT